MGLLGLLSLLHSAFFGDQVGHWGLCRGGRGSALGWGVLTMGTMVQAAGGAQTLSRKLEGFGGLTLSPWRPLPGKLPQAVGRAGSPSPAPQRPPPSGLRKRGLAVPSPWP